MSLGAVFASPLSLMSRVLLLETSLHPRGLNLTAICLAGVLIENGAIALKSLTSHVLAVGRLYGVLVATLSAFLAS